MPDNVVFHPFMLVDGDKEAMRFARGQRAVGLADALQYVQADLVHVAADGTVQKATGGGGTLERLALAGQPYNVPALMLPPDDGSNPDMHWMYERGVPLNLIPDDHEFVFSIRGGAGGAAAVGTDYALAEADIATIQAGTPVELFYDTTEGCHVVDLSRRATPNVRLSRMFRRGDVVGDTNVLVTTRILPEYLRK